MSLELNGDQKSLIGLSGDHCDSMSVLEIIGAQ